MGRLKTVGVFLTFLAVAALTGSLVHGLLPPAERSVERTEGEAEDAPIESRVRVEVLNGSGVPGQAQTLTRSLRDRGFDVVYFGNASAFDVDTTVVIDRIGAPERAREVADAMGVRRVESVPDRDLYVDVTVVIGADWDAVESEDDGRSEGQ